MLQPGPARKVTIYVNEDARHGHAPLHEAIVQFLLRQGAAGATVTRGLSGFGDHRKVHTSKIEFAAFHLPLRIEFIEAPARVDAILPSLCDLVGDGLIEMQETTVVKYASAPR